MRFFLDSADVDEVREFRKMGVISGVTTNPSLVKSSGRGYIKLIEEICDIMGSDVSAEVIATDADAMVREGLKLSSIHEAVVVKLPVTDDGIVACYKLVHSHGIKVNMTLCFSVAQALLVARVGATFVSPFIGRLDDVGQNGLELLDSIVKVYTVGNLRTEIIAASVRSVHHVVESAKLGVHIATVPAKVLVAMSKHPLTDKGLEKFLSDWELTGQSILRE